MKILSIRQPWPWFIFNEGKDIENRNWYTDVRGRVLVHAGLGCTKLEYESALASARYIGVNAPPPLAELPRGGIVGSVEITGCVATSSSSWFYGRFGFTLRNPQPLPFIPLRGQIGFWDAPDDVMAIVEAHKP